MSVQTPPRVQPRSVETMAVWRCSKCGRILARLNLKPGSSVEIKCSVCNTFATKEAA